MNKPAKITISTGIILALSAGVVFGTIKSTKEVYEEIDAKVVYVDSDGEELGGEHLFIDFGNGNPGGHDNDATHKNGEASEGSGGMINPYYEDEKLGGYITGSAAFDMGVTLAVEVYDTDHNLQYSKRMTEEGVYMPSHHLQYLPEQEVIFMLAQPNFVPKLSSTDPREEQSDNRIYFGDIEQEVMMEYDPTYMFGFGPEVGEPGHNDGNRITEDDVNGTTVTEDMVGDFKYYNENDFGHFNAMDINDNGEVIVSAPYLSMVFSFTAYDVENEEGIDPLEAELNGILSNNYTYSYSQMDVNGTSPIILDEPEEGDTYSDKHATYTTHPDYIPELNSNGTDIALDIVIPHELIDGENTDVVLEASNPVGSDEYAEYLFGMQHAVQYANNYLEATGVYADYNSDYDYIIMYDNHDPYGKYAASHYEGDHTGDGVAYTKMFEIDSANQTATLILNEETSGSPVMSHSKLMEVDGQNYFITSAGGYQGTPSSKYEIYTFDAIVDGNLTNKEAVYIVEYADGYDSYKVMPIFRDISEIESTGNSMYYM